MRNRIGLSPLTNRQSNADGTASQDDLRWLTMRAEGGFGMVMTCGTFVNEEGRGFAGQLGASHDRHIEGLSKLAGAVRERGALAILQMQHAGRRSPSDLTGGPPVVPVAGEDNAVRVLSTDEVERTIDDYVAAAGRAESAGFNGVEIHSAHGYLACEFLGLENKREDGWGGSFAERRRFLDMIIEGVRAATSPGFQLGVRLSPERHNLDTGEALILAETLMQSGNIDFLDMSLWDSFASPMDPRYSDRSLIDLFGAIPKGECRLGVAGKVGSAADVEHCIESGADFVLLGRGGILHHNWPQKLEQDGQIASRSLPVSSDYLRSEGLGEAFIDYLQAFPGMIED
jgi:2,4-dienoyl-CoA reductase-like NADH-dependent reductase (Old Yellow Enzyme family)